MIELFISHASEDKSDFVRPLANALKHDYRVWFDEFELVIGDSLFQKINQGLSSCDYGVVVLSRSFFQKKWPQTELDGLFALETTQRKIILPIWKDITQEEIARYSPILAGRLAANASHGVDTVVRELRNAIEVSNRTRQISVTDSIFQRAKAFEQTLKERQNAQRLSNSEAGVVCVTSGFDELFETIKSSLHEIRKNSEFIKLTISTLAHQGFGPNFTVTAHFGLAASVQLTGLGGNYTTEAELSIVLFQRTSLLFGQQGNPNIIRRINFKPTFRIPNEVVWKANRDTEVLTTKEMATYILEELMEEIEKMDGGN